LEISSPSEQLPPLNSFPSPPPLNSRNKNSIIAAASAKQFAQLPPSVPQTSVKLKKVLKYFFFLN
jgi:hypothetical protein